MSGFDQPPDARRTLRIQATNMLGFIGFRAWGSGPNALLGSDGRPTQKASKRQDRQRWVEEFGLWGVLGLSTYKNTQNNYLDPFHSTGGEGSVWHS